MKNMNAWLILAGLLMPAAAFSGEAGTTIKASDLKAQPFNDAKTIASIKRGASVDILGREGGWMQIRAGKHQGWVRMLNIRRGAAQANLDLPGVMKLASGRAATGNIAATTGIRGLSEEDLRGASFNAVEIKALESYTVTRDAAQQFARQHQRQNRRVDYVAGPQGGAS